MQHHKLIILGSGPAGATSAIYSGRALYKPVIFTGPQYGGQLTLTNDIENYPGFVNSMTGTNLIQEMLKQAEKAGATLISEVITKVDLSKKPFFLASDENEYSCDALIIATGSKARWLGLPSEEIYRTGGISACATCDGFLYKGKEVIVIGGGNSALDEALYLSNLASKVTIVHRRDSFNAEAIMQKRIANTPNISIRWNSEVKEFIGSKNKFNQDILNSVRIENIIDKTEEIVKIDGVFIAIGHEPQSELFKDFLELDENNYIKTVPNSTVTNIKGVFAAGDVADPTFRQAITSAGRGCMAAIEVDKFLRLS